MLHYTMCGLDNVWLENGYEVHRTAYGKGVSIVEADELHRILAADIVAKKGRLTGKELRFLRVQMGLSQAGLAKLQGVTEQAVSLWERHGKVPKANDQLTRIYYLGHVKDGTPIARAIERVKAVEKLVHQRIVASTSRRGWKSKVEDVQEDSQARHLEAA